MRKEAPKGHREWGKRRKAHVTAEKILTKWGGALNPAERTSTRLDGRKTGRYCANFLHSVGGRKKKTRAKERKGAVRLREEGRCFRY